ncbi:MAG: SPW repeat protein [Magnetospirillum sp.]|nr:SPW repeat protein [Magnetospirillum sp.]
MPIGTRAHPTFWQDWVNLIIGAWLFVSPWVLGYADLPAAAWNSWIFGIVVAVVSIAALIQFAQWEEWINVLFGVWLLAAPWVMGFAAAGEPAPVWNHVGVGLVVGILALWDVLSHRETALPAE